MAVLVEVDGRVDLDQAVVVVHGPAVVAGVALDLAHSPSDHDGFTGCLHIVFTKNYLK